ncbi:MAG TPA: MarC family protein, partial [Armatimonadota bacterium]|nr:MarC family protein [Armatimonadota bacterium]
FVLSAAARLRARLGQTGIRVLTRIMGVFLAAIAVEFITSGLGDLLPGLVTVKGP